MEERERERERENKQYVRCKHTKTESQFKTAILRKSSSSGQDAHGFDKNTEWVFLFLSLSVFLFHTNVSSLPFLIRVHSLFMFMCPCRPLGTFPDLTTLSITMCDTDFTPIFRHVETRQISTGPTIFLFLYFSVKMDSCKVYDFEKNVLHIVGEREFRA